MKMQRVGVLAIFQMVFVLANCYEITSYDTPQQAMKDASGIEVRDGTNNILTVGKNSVQSFLNNVYTIFEQREIKRLFC